VFFREQLLEGIVKTTVTELENSDSIEQRSKMVKKADELLDDIQVWTYCKV
jgi:hypothetical protein